MEVTIIGPVEVSAAQAVDMERRRRLYGKHPTFRSFDRASAYCSTKAARRKFGDWGTCLPVVTRGKWMN